MTSTQVPPHAEGTARSAASTLTASPREVVRRGRFWVVLSLVALALVAIATVLAGGGSSGLGAPLAADNAAPAGGQALARVLQQQGVTVVNASSYESARAALAEGNATLLLLDFDERLDTKRMRVLRNEAASTVIVAPRFAQLSELMPGVAAAGKPKGSTLDAGCSLPAAARAGTVTTGGQSFRVDDDSYVRCFTDGNSRSLLVSDPETKTTALASTQLLDNEGITARGNAALALGVLGEHETLVWYSPSLADAAFGAPPTRSELTPGWVTPVIVLLIAAVIAAAIWRGRRLGPLVIENLPVTVPARETMEGRARLYARSSARLRALDALRVGTVARLASSLGLPRTATVTDVADAAAAITRRHRDSVRALLLDTLPTSDAELVRLSSELEALENDVRAATRLNDG